KFHYERWVDGADLVCTNIHIMSMYAARPGDPPPPPLFFFGRRAGGKTRRCAVAASWHAFSVTSFVATLLRRFDVEVVGSLLKFPQTDEGRPVFLGIMSIKEDGEEFMVGLSP
ncbi:hypothetical protein GGR50DRAFT_641535, partial [Xylaria sp. CBS 124048]